MPGWQEAHPSWVPLGTVRGPQGDTIVAVPYTMGGTLVIKPGQAPYPVIGGSFELLDVAARVGSGPAGSPVVIDVNVNGASIYATEADQPTIAPGTLVAVTGPHLSTVVDDGDYLTVDVDQPGSVPGANLVVVVRLIRVQQTP